MLEFLAQGALLLLLSLYIGRLASTGKFGFELVSLFLVAIAFIALMVPPHVFVALALLVFGSYSLSEANPLGFAGPSIYSTDLLLGITVLRALLPLERVEAAAPLDTLTKLLFGCWALAMLVAGARGVLADYSLVSVIRLETPLLYSLGFFVGLSRIVRERVFDLDKAVRNLLLIALGFVVYMAIARLANIPFEGFDEAESQQGRVLTTEGEFRRDYGFGSAFILYPVIGLAGAAYLLFAPRRELVAAAVAATGVLATLLTLVRSQIFGLFLGLAVLFVLRNDSAFKAAVRARAIALGTFALVIVGFGLWAVNPSLARGIAERSLPGLVEQTEAAESTADFRRRSLEAGFEAASREPAGVGLIPGEGLDQLEGIGRGYVAHSGVTTMLVYTGWVGFIAALLALLGLLRASFRLPRPTPWLHAAFVASLLMMTVYTITADGLVGQGWVTGIAALIAAIRFGAPPAAEHGGDHRAASRGSSAVLERSAGLPGESSAA